MQSEIFQAFICYNVDYGLQIWKNVHNILILNLVFSYL